MDLNAILYERLKHLYNAAIIQNYQNFSNVECMVWDSSCVQNQHRNYRETQFSAPWTHDGANRIPMGSRQRFNSPPWPYRERQNWRDLSRDTHRQLTYPHKTVKNRRRRSHLDDVFRPNFEDREEHCPGRVSGSNKHWGYKKRNSIDNKNTKDNKETCSNIDIKLNLLPKQIKDKKTLTTSESKDTLQNEKDYEKLKSKSTRENESDLTVKSKDTDEEKSTSTVMNVPEEKMTIDLTSENPVVKEKYSPNQTNEKEVTDDIYDAPTQKIIDLTVETEIHNEKKKKNINYEDSKPSEVSIDSIDPIDPIDIPVSNDVSGEHENTNEKISDIFEAATQEINLDSENNDCFVSSNKENTNEKINDAETSEYIFEAATQEFLLDCENISSDTNELEDNSQVNEILNVEAPFEQKNDKIEIPFLENSPGKTTDAALGSDKKLGSEQSQINLTPEKYLHYCESVEHEVENCNMEEYIASSSTTKTINRSPKRKSGDETEKSPAKRVKIDSYPEINVCSILEEIDDILGNNNAPEGQDVLNSTSSNENETKTALQSKTEESNLTTSSANKNSSSPKKVNKTALQSKTETSNLTTSSANKNGSSPKKINKKKVNIKKVVKQLEKADSREHVEKPKHVISKRQYHENNGKLKRNKKNSHNFRKKSDHPNRLRYKHVLSNNRESCQTIFSDVHEPYLEKFRHLFGEDDNDSEDLKCLEESLKLRMAVKKSICRHKGETSNKIPIIKTNVVSKDEVKKRYRNSSLKQILDTMKKTSKSIKPRVTEIKVVLEDFCKSEKSTVNQNIKSDKTSRRDSSDNVDLSKQIAINLKYGKQSEIIFSSCSAIAFESFCRACIEVAVDNLCYTAVTMDEPDIQNLVVVVPTLDSCKQNAAEIHSDNPNVDLADNSSNCKEDSKDELLSILKEEPEPTNTETITLYRSEDTLNPHLEVQAHSAVIGETRKDPQDVNQDCKNLGADFCDGDRKTNENQTDENRKTEDSRNIIATLPCNVTGNEKRSNNKSGDSQITTTSSCEINSVDASGSDQSNKNAETFCSDQNQNMTISNNWPKYQKSPNPIPQKPVSGSNVTTSEDISANNETQMPSLVPNQRCQINITFEPSVSGYSEMQQRNIEFQVTSDIPVSGAISTPIRKFENRSNVVNNISQELPNNSGFHGNRTISVSGDNVNTNYSNPLLPITSQIFQNLNVLNGQSWGQHSNDNRNGLHQPLGTNLAPNFNSIINQDFKVLLTEITRLFSESIVFYVHVLRHHKIYLNSIKELNWFAPDLVKVEAQIAIAQMNLKLGFLAKRLRGSLQQICDNRNIDLNANKWFEHLFQTAKRFIPTFTKGQLFYLLNKLMEDHSEYYLSIPYLTTIFNVARSTLKLIELKYPIVMTEEQRKTLKMQIEQYWRIVSVMPQQQARTASPGKTVTINSGTLPIFNTAVPTNSSISDTQSKLCQYPTNMTQANYSAIASKSYNKQCSVNPNCISSCTNTYNPNYFQSAKKTSNILPSLSAANGRVNVPNLKGPQKPYTTSTNNQPALKILSDVVINPGPQNRPIAQNVQTADNYKIALPLSKPYDLQCTDSIIRQNTKGSQLSNSSTLAKAVGNNISNSRVTRDRLLETSVNCSETSRVPSIETRISQRTAGSAVEMQNSVNENVINHCENRPHSNIVMNQSDTIFKAPNPVSQQRSSYSNISERKSIKSSSGTNETLVPEYNSQNTLKSLLMCNNNSYNQQEVPNLTIRSRNMCLPKETNKAPLDFAGNTPRYTTNNDLIHKIIEKQFERFQERHEKLNKKSNSQTDLSSKCGETLIEDKSLTPVSNGSTPEQTVPPALRNIKSPVYAPMLFSPRSYMDDSEETELTCTPENEVIDLTWMEDADPQQLENEIREFCLKKEEPDDDEVILNQEQFPVSDYNALAFVDRLCICNNPALYVCQCRMVMYCSELCQMKDWKEHKTQCMRVREQETDRN